MIPTMDFEKKPSTADTISKFEVQLKNLSERVEFQKQKLDSFE
jgi:hypothetical protein